MMDLDSAIKHCEEVAEKNEWFEKNYLENKGCKECAKEHRQLAEWLKELKAYKEQGGDAISRQIVIDRINKQRAGLNPDIYPQDKIGDCAYRICIEFVEKIPSVTPQQRTGRWERMSDLPNDADDRFKCSRCGNIVHYNNVMDLRTFSRWCGRCGSDNG